MIAPCPTKTLTLHAWSAEKLASKRLPGRTALLRMADEEALLVPAFDAENVVMQMDVFLYDAEEDYHNIESPTDEHAKVILEFFQDAEFSEADHFVAQCDGGIGRSVAVCAAIDRIRCIDVYPASGYNRRLYQSMLAVADVPLPVEPLVSLAVRVKYGPEKLHLFLLSMAAQRYDNWEVVAYTDGPNRDAEKVVEQFNDHRVRLIQTEKRMGRWGHPYRQMALSQCRGDWIGTQNDDNYLTPGFLEQLVELAERRKAKIVSCGMLHRYFGWRVVDPGGDLCCWIARADLVHRVPWEGTDFHADSDYLDLLMKTAGRENVVATKTPLVVKN